MTSGARFYRSDLHIHTPASLDYEDKKATPQEIVEAAISKELEIIAVTDHNSAAWTDMVSEAAASSSLTVIPGVEISTQSGHVLALFECGTTREAIEDLLNKVDINRSDFGKEEALSGCSIQEVIEHIERRGAVAIAAHLQGRQGAFKRLTGQARIKLVGMKTLRGLEFTTRKSIDDYSRGKPPSFAPKASIQNSDAHSLSQIGERVTYLKMQHPGLAGIRYALMDHPIKVRFEWNRPTLDYPQIISLSVDQGFFGGEHFVFESGLNCLIGGKGTGKSTIIELLRYCFGDSPSSEFKNIREDHDSKLSILVGEGGKVCVEYRDSDGETKLISREISETSPEREVKDQEGNVATILTPPIFFSQGELVQIASSKLAQLDLIDLGLDLRAFHTAEAKAIDDLTMNASTLLSTQRRISQLEEEIGSKENGKAVTLAERKRLSDQLKDPILKAFPKWETESRAISAFVEDLESLANDLDESFTNLEIEGLEIPEEAPNAAALKKLAKVPKEVRALSTKTRKDFRRGIDAIIAKVTKVQESLHAPFSERKREYEAAKTKIGADDVKKASGRLRKLEERLQTLKGYETELKGLKRDLTQLHNSRAEFKTRLAEARQTRWERRRERGLELESNLDGLVAVQVAKEGDREEYRELIDELQRSGRVREKNIAKLADAIHPTEFLELIRSDNVEGIVTRAGIKSEAARRLIAACLEKDEEALFRIETVGLQDRPFIKYVFEDGKTKALNELSTGQKGTVIISLAMTEGLGPLVIDQPEEPLDTESIYGKIVKALRSSKDQRQYIVTTHNPNIAVGADAELSHILRATADSGYIQQSGAIDDDATRNLLLIHLEGGKDALDLRVEKFRRSQM